MDMMPTAGLCHQVHGLLCKSELTLPAVSRSLYSSLEERGLERALQLALVAEGGPTECWKALGIELKED